MKIVLFCFFVSSLTAFANCNYKLQNDILLYEGYHLNFGEYLEQNLKDKGFVRTSSTDQYVINSIFETKQSGHFQKAYARFDLIDSHHQIISTGEETQTCLTQQCALSDAKKALVGSINKFIKNTKKCL